MLIEIASEELHRVLSATSVYRDEAIMQFKKRGIMIRVQDPSGTALYNTLIPDSAMDEYKPGERTRLGIYVEDMLDFTPNDTSNITVELVSDTVNKFNMQYGSREFRIPAIDPDTVSGEPEMVPSLDMPIKIKLDPDRLTSFINDAYDRVYKGSEQASFYIQAQNGTFNLWSRHDDRELFEYFHWEDFEDYDIDWSATTEADRDTLVSNPSENEKAVSLMSCNLTKDMMFFTDSVRMEMGHGMPLKMVSETDAGVKHSWIVPPRFPTDGDHDQIPERVIKDRAVV